MVLKDICNFADDTLPHTCDISFDELLMRLEHDSDLAVCSFESNYMKLNTDKCHLIISGNKHESFWQIKGRAEYGGQIMSSFLE